LVHLLTCIMHAYAFVLAFLDIDASERDL